MMKEMRWRRKRKRKRIRKRRIERLGRVGK